MRLQYNKFNIWYSVLLCTHTAEMYILKNYNLKAKQSIYYLLRIYANLKSQILNFILLENGVIMGYKSVLIIKNKIIYLKYT